MSRLNHPPEIFLFVGRLHPLLVHLPIGMIVVLAMLELAARIPRFKNAAASAGFILAFVTPLAVVTAGCGWLLSLAGGYEEKLLEWHKWLGLATAAGCVVTAILFRCKKTCAYRTSLFATAAVLMAAQVACAQDSAKTPKPSNDPEVFLREPPKPLSVKGDFTLVAVGDMLYSHPEVNSPDQKLQKVFDLVRSADVSVSNQEGVFMDLHTFKGAPYGDGQLWGEATLARDMKAIGLDIVSVANNHSTDFGADGLLESMRLLDEAGLAHAGGGHDREEALRAGITTTPKGRVAMVATASTFKPNSRANDAFGLSLQ